MGGLSIYIHKHFWFKIRHDLSINCKIEESLSVEITFHTVQKTLFNVLYRLPNGTLVDPFETFFWKKFLVKQKIPTICYTVAGDFNLNLLDHENYKKVQYFLNPVYQMVWFWL